MKTFIIVNKESLEIMGSYQAMTKEDSTATRSWLEAEPMCKHIEMPNGLQAKYLMAEMQEDKIVLAHSSEKETADLEQAWDMLRSERNRRLTESDFSMLEDIPFNQQTKQLWANYRQALRELPEEVADPRQEVQWPAKPE